MKKPLILIGSGIIIIATILAIKGCSNSGAVEVTTEKVQRRTIVETVSANGKIQPEVELKITSDVSGEIVELNVKEGDHVEKGDIVAKLRPNAYQSQLDRAQASMNTMQANLANAKAQLAQIQAQFANAQASFERNKKLFDQGAISQADFLNAKSQYETSKAQVEAAEENIKASSFNINSAQASVNEAQENLNKTSIYSPVSGTVSKLSKKKGERVAGNQFAEGTEIMILANLNEMQVNVDVNENDIVRVHLMDTADIEVDAYTGRKFKGIVTEIANSANTSATQVASDQVTNFTVKIRVLQDSYKDLMKNNISPFRPGMSASVDIHTKRAVNVLSLPIQAVTTRSDSAMNAKDEKKNRNSDYDTKVVDEKKEKLEMNNKKDFKPNECVFIFQDGKVKLQKVKTGIQDNIAIEITEGIKEGDEVVNGPYNAVAKMLKDGMQVKKSDKTEIANSWKAN